MGDDHLNDSDKQEMMASRSDSKACVIQKEDDLAVPKLEQSRTQLLDKMKQ